MVQPNSLRIAYYESNDGPRIVVFGPMTAEVSALQDVFRSLSRGEGPFDLETLPFVAALHGIRIHARCSGGLLAHDDDKQQGVRRIGTSDARVFEWSRTCEGWDYLAELLQALRVSHTPAHQYLSAYPNEDAIVVVSRGEYDDSVFQ